MTSLESKKLRLISAIISDSDESRVLKIERLYSSMPCAYSDEQMRESVIRRKEDYKNGKIFIVPHDHIKRRVI